MPPLGQIDQQARHAFGMLDRRRGPLYLRTHSASWSMKSCLRLLARGKCI